MNNLGDRLSTSPEQGPLRYALPIEEVFVALEYADTQRPDASETDPALRDSLYGLSELFQKGFVGPEWETYRKAAELIPPENESWMSRSTALLANLLSSELLEEYTAMTAGQANLYTQFLAEHPGAIRLGASDGPVLTAVDAEFTPFDPIHPPKQQPAHVVAYTNTDELYDLQGPTHLFVDTAALTAGQQQSIRSYYRDMEVPPFAILEPEKEE